MGGIERASSHEVIRNHLRLTIKQRALKEYLLVKILHILYWLFLHVTLLKVYQLTAARFCFCSSASSWTLS